MSGQVSLASASANVAPQRCARRLEPNPDTRARYPFEFRLDVSYALASDRLTIRAVVANLGSRPMPASFGFDPAFRWPLTPGAAGVICIVGRAFASTAGFDGALCNKPGVVLIGPSASYSFEIRISVR
jgi:hypothetical protein